MITLHVFSKAFRTRICFIQPLVAQVALIEQSVITTQENTSSIKYRESIYCSLLQTVLYTIIIVYLPNLTFVNGTTLLPVSVSTPTATP